MVIAAIATWKFGAVVTLIPPLARADEVEFFLEDTQPRLLVLMQAEDLDRFPGLTVVAVAAVQASRPGVLDWDALLESAGPRPDVATDLDRVAIVWHTGGTTGRPKGC